jgi:trehalose 6-phosphate synthase/phosphatase
MRLDVNFNEISHHDRVIKVDSFPMGIDYAKFNNAAKTIIKRALIYPIFRSV